ncbi:MAG: hypothetical protein AUK47_03105 [Deltaproteobacteria bacterium CG2_30_63_29]|nr:MAG: hypothetical protein AUK47_03105 [Deltaproteobacteria bacterium CG2_30_63_29]PJB38115.1 MAG: translation initiation factor [Deltaproteobacteria bacterium CG_4_9_14_3_um_filter_63_12]
MKKDKKTERLDATRGEGFSNSPFASLPRPASCPSREEPATLSDLRTVEPVSTDLPTPRRVVLRYERKGRGGKAVTVVEQLVDDPAQLQRWCSKLKKHLGCGGVVEEQGIVLQGDQRARLAAFFAQAGVDKISQ